MTPGGKWNGWPGVPVLSPRIMKTLLKRPALPLMAALLLGGCDTSPKALEVVKDELHKVGYNYEVRGEIHNPRQEPVRDVRVSYEVWGKYKGKPNPDYGQIIEETGGRVEASIRYIPAGATVEFTATGVAPVLMADSVHQPDPLTPVIEEPAEAAPH